MLKVKRGSMEKISFEDNQSGTLLRAPDLTRRSIERVSGHWMPNRRKMHPNLVCAAGLNPDLKQRKLAIAAVDLLQNFPVGNGFASLAAARSHALAAHQVAADWGCNYPLRLKHPAVHQREIDLFCFPPGKLLGQLAMRFIGFGHYDQPAGLFIKPVYDTGPEFASCLGKLAEMVQQRVHHCAFAASFILA